MAEISVIVPTNRPGGLDLLLSGMAVQTFRDCELILVDNLHPLRRQIVAEKAAEWGVKVKHVPPYEATRNDTGSESGQYQRALNTGIAHASGGIIVILCDYTYLAPDCLTKHRDFHRTNTNAAYMGTLKYAHLPKLSEKFPLRYGWYEMGHDPARDSSDTDLYRSYLNDEVRMSLFQKWGNAYASDLRSGLLEPFMWSVFHEPVSPPFMENSWDVYRHEKRELPEGIVAYQYCNLKNNSFTTQSLLDINGLDEGMDFCHCHQDSELAGRLQSRLGMKFHLGHDCLAYFFDPHGIAIIRNMNRIETANLEYYNKKVSNGFSDPVNSYSLASKREETLRRENSVTNLNLGSGFSTPDSLNVITMDHTGWKHIDVCPLYVPPENCYDLTEGIREPDDSIQEIWMGDVLEHIFRVKTDFVLGECFRVLKKGGRLRVMVPDMVKAMPLWLASDGKNEELSNLVWGQQDALTRRNQIPDSHFNGFTEKSLSEKLMKAGFSKVERIDIHRCWYELAFAAWK